MKQEHFFRDAIWVGAQERQTDTFSVLYDTFPIHGKCRATLHVLGLGFFKCYINGTLINPDCFLPLSSEYEASAFPVNEIFTGKRVYVPIFDITSYLVSGENLIAIHYGGGWYCADVRPFGLPKVIYSIQAEYEDTTEFYGSDENALIGKSFVSSYHFTYMEAHDYTAPISFATIPEGCEKAVATEALVTEYLTTDCPIDTLIASHTPKALGERDGGIVYDAGKNLTGYPVLQVSADAGEIVVLFSEALLPDGTPDPTHMHEQCFRVVGGAQERVIQAELTWFGFRYFWVFGKATPLSVSEVHADIPKTSTFHSSNETLNWIYDTFLHTMLCNMHTGHPSDCPHIERRGYTGDGQLTMHAVLTTLGAKAFYEKWLCDIADSQDILSGHVQYTAPYVASGGGPGGWGCAIVEVPYQLYRHYGEEDILTRYYPNMRRYIDYLEAHSEFSLVTSDKEGAWCLGDWCGPNILYPEKDITAHNQQVVLPAPMVNTYFMVKSLLRLAEIARIIGKEEDVEEYIAKAEIRKKAIQAAYFNAFDGNFIMNIQGANAYGVDLGLGNEQTYLNMVDYYKKLGHYDTGIFATDILTRVLFERGDVDLAIELLTHNGTQGYEHWRQNGATTFHEYWDSNRSRSHNHPMFGAPVAYLFEYVLGIRQAKGGAGYSSLVISPVATRKISSAAGSMETPNGTVSVSYTNENDNISFQIVIPEGTRAVFQYNNTQMELRSGENVFSL